MNTTEPEPPLPLDWAGEPRIIAFYIPLPRPLAIPEGTRVTFARPEEVSWLERVEWPGELASLRALGTESFVTLRVARPTTVTQLSVEPIDRAFRVARSRLGIDAHAPHEDTAVSPPLDMDVRATVIEAITPLIRAPGMDRERAVSDAFDRSLEELTLLETAYVLTSRDSGYRPTARPTACPLIPWTTLDPFVGRWGSLGLFWVNTSEQLLPPDPGDLDDAQMSRLLQRLSYLRQRSAITTYGERVRAAERALAVDGDYPTALIACHTAGEVFFDALLLALAWEEIYYFNPPPTTIEETVTWFSGRASLESRLRSLYHVRLAGSWDLSLLDTPLGRWAAHVAVPRHRAVHAGYRPSEAEAIKAFDTLLEAEQYALGILSNDRNRGRYPRANMMLLGRDGLERRGLYGGKLRRLVENSREDWARSFKDYRDWLDGQLSRG